MASYFIEPETGRPLQLEALTVYDSFGRISQIPLEKVEEEKYKGTTTGLSAGLHFVIVPGYSKPQRVMIVR